MQDNKNPFNAILGKMIVTKEGKRLGFVRDITFETRSGELINLIVKNNLQMKCCHKRQALVFLKDLSLDR